MNTDLATKAKDIKLKGVKAIPDSLISVYNEDGIKAVALFDAGRIFTYELAVPLKYFGLSVKDQSKFNYNLMLNGLDKSNIHDIAPNSRGLVRVINVSNGFTSARSSNIGSIIYPMDFWGDYELVK